MKKVLVIFLITISSVLSFSAKPMQNKKDVELKAMLHAGYDPIIPEHINVLIEVGAYKKFEINKTKAIINVGGGVDLSNYFDGDTYNGFFRPYFSTEIGGYVSKDIRMFTDIKLGVGAFIRESFVETFPKASVSLGMTYKEHFTVEMSYNTFSTISLGFGSRFGF